MKLSSSAKRAPVPTTPRAPRRATLKAPFHLLPFAWGPIMSGGALVVQLPFRLVNETNAHEHWRSRQKRAKDQRGTTALLMRQAFGEPPAPPLRVLIVRIAPREMDSDGVVASAKSVRDGIADWLGINDRSPLVTWDVEQERAEEPRTYGVRVEVSRR